MIVANSDLAKALGRIKAKTFVIAFEEDMFVLLRDCEYEQKLIPNSEFRPIPTLMGHFGTLGVFEEDFVAIDNTFKELLETPV